MAKLYRIATEDNPNLPTLASGFFDSFYLTNGVGYWKGQAEKGAAIEVLTDDVDKVHQLAEYIRSVNHQEAVYIMGFDATSELVTGSSTLAIA